MTYSDDENKKIIFNIFKTSKLHNIGKHPESTLSYNIKFINYNNQQYIFDMHEIKNYNKVIFINYAGDFHVSKEMYDFIN
jgi:hypothetical protein